jgi:branched-chain amino acid transport system ATP-binding protein
MSTEPLLKTVNLSKAFGGVQALLNVSFSIMPGELLGVIGPNGSGKTTLVNLITRFVKPSSGKVLFKGSPIHQLPRTRSSGSALPEHFRWSGRFISCRPSRT